MVYIQGAEIAVEFLVVPVKGEGARVILNPASVRAQGVNGALDATQASASVALEHEADDLLCCDCIQIKAAKCFWD